MKELIKKVALLPNCIVLPPVGAVNLPQEYVIPKELLDFYRLCGGMILFEDSPYAIKIVGPQDFRNADYEILGAEIVTLEMEKGTYEAEISKDWFIIADLFNADYIVIDLNKDRAGRCYKAFWDSYPEEGSSTIIAKSFRELLEKLIKNNGEYWWFLRDEFVSYGDAYDDIDIE